MLESTEQDHINIISIRHRILICDMALNLNAIKKLGLYQVRDPSQTSIKVAFSDGCLVMLKVSDFQANAKLTQEGKRHSDLNGQFNAHLRKYFVRIFIASLLCLCCQFRLSQ